MRLNQLVLPAVALSAVCLIGIPADAADGIPDGHCELTLNQSTPAPWIVDDDVNDRIPFGLSNEVLSNSDLENSLNVALQNKFRFSRAASKARVLFGFGECSVFDGDTTPCVEAVTNTQDPSTCGTFPSSLAWTWCGTGGCNIEICQSHGWTGSWQDGTWAKTLEHETGHAYGQEHINDESATGCTGVANNGLCSNSDGCDGEEMCTLTACIASPFETEGDNVGLRTKLGPSGSFSRKIWWQSDPISDGMDTPSRAQFGTTNVAAYEPRIACASSSSPTNQCAAVWADRSASGSAIKIVRLNSPAGSAGWNTQTIVRQLSITTSVFAPDIAVNSSGTIAYIVFTDTSHHPVFVRVPLDGSASTTLSLATVSSVSLVATLPPRIEFADGQPRVLVADAVSLGSSEAFAPPMFRLVNVAEDGTSAALDNLVEATGGVNIDCNSCWAGTHALMDEFDFACRQVGTLARCTIVAQYYHDDEDLLMTRTHSIRFEIDGSSTTANLIDTDWAHDAVASDGIVGVALNSSANLFVSASVPVSGTSTTNTSVTQTTGESVAGTVVSTSSHRGDADTCNTGSGNGQSFGASGMFGGYSIAWCPSCGGTSGTIESVGWGDRSDGNADCF